MSRSGSKSDVGGKIEMERSDIGMTLARRFPNTIVRVDTGREQGNELAGGGAGDRRSPRMAAERTRECRLEVEQVEVKV